MKRRRTWRRTRGPSRRAPTEGAQLERIEKGEGGERTLQDWLDRSRLAYLYLDQTPLTIPMTCRADLKRPDFLVALDNVGTIAVDAKAKTFVDDSFLIKGSERRRLDGFEARFAIPVWYAVFEPGDRASCTLFRNRGLMGQRIECDSARALLRVPRHLGYRVEFARLSFSAALARAEAYLAATAARMGGDTGFRPEQLRGAANCAAR
jgi:hypothetical protein